MKGNIPKTSHIFINLNIVTIDESKLKTALSIHIYLIKKYLININIIKKYNNTF